MSVGCSAVDTVDDRGVREAEREGERREGIFSTSIDGIYILIHMFQIKCCHVVKRMVSAFLIKGEGRTSH